MNPASDLVIEQVQLGADACVELPRDWPCGLSPSGAWWCRDPDGRYSLEITHEILPDESPADLPPLDHALRCATRLREEAARRPGLIDLTEEPTQSGVLLRADWREGSSRVTCWRSLLGFDRSVAESRFTLRMPQERWGDPVVPTLVASLRAQSLRADLTPPAALASVRDYRIDDICVIGIPASWRLRRDDDAFWFYAPGGTPKLTVSHHWSDLPAHVEADPEGLGLALAYDFQASLRRRGEDSDVEAAPLGGLVTTFAVDEDEDEERGADPPLAVTAWYYLIPVGARVLLITFGLMIQRAMLDEPAIAALPGAFRSHIQELRLAAP
jgi:hypothetical protein